MQSHGYLESNWLFAQLSYFLSTVGGFNNTMVLWTRPLRQHLGLDIKVSTDHVDLIKSREEFVKEQGKNMPVI